jgi:UDP-GlcNAc:undecaprenyl-phosphate/decaprenyl-phosphate GlcNAc-1-phosphate transferase
MGQIGMLLAISLFAVVALWATAGLGRRIDLVDRPSGRKKHVGDIPLTGGLAIFATLLFGVAMLAIPPYTAVSLALAGGLVMVSVYDDYQHLNAIVRLAVHFGFGVLLAVTGGITISNVGDLLAGGDIPLLLLSVPLTALAVAGLCNAYNMIDGINGLSASLAALPLAVLFFLARRAGHDGADFALLILIPCLAFLLFNLGPDNAVLPRVFLAGLFSHRITGGFFAGRGRGDSTGNGTVASCRAVDGHDSHHAGTLAPWGKPDQGRPLASTLFAGG